jgi:terpene synthase-like protein
MAEIVQGMLTERRWSISSSPPSFQAYLANGMTTIAVRPYTLTGCVLTGERDAVAAFETLDPMINAAARCFRLANDLRSDSRERQEGKLNALTLLLAGHPARSPVDADALRAARCRLRDICVADLEYLDQARRAAPAQIATLARFLWAHTAFVWDMYQISDYDTVSSFLRDGVIS